MPDRSLKGAMIGAGFFARFQAEAWKRVAGVELAAVADTVPGRAEAFAQNHGIARAYPDAASMLQSEQPDFVDIVTRPDSHRELTELAARFCRAVICQKPMAPTYEDCAAMIADCDRRGVRLLIHENWRWQPWYREARRLMLAGAIGRAFHLAFRMRTGDGRDPEPYSVQPYFRDMERLLVYETATHFLDTFRYLGGELDSVYCRTDRINPSIRGEDYALIQVSFADGAHGLIDANRISGSSPPEVAFGEFRIEGDGGMIRIAPDGALYLTEYGRPEFLSKPPGPDAGYKGDSVYGLQEHIAECLWSGELAESEGARHLETVKAVEACYRSAQSGAPVRLR